MKKASNKAYISKNQMVLYQRELEKARQKELNPDA